MEWSQGDIVKLERSLAQCTGTSQYFKHWTNKMLYTDGIHILMEEGKCGWLIDAIASYQGDRRVVGVPFQLWTLKVHEDKSAVLTMKEDSDRPILIEQKFDYTDFPLAEMKMYLIDDGENKVLILPSEY